MSEGERYVCPVCCDLTREVPYSRKSRCKGCGAEFDTATLREQREPATREDGIGDA